MKFYDMLQNDEIKFSYLQNVVTYTYDCIIQVCSRKTIQTTGVMPSYLPSWSSS